MNGLNGGSNGGFLYYSGPILMFRLIKIGFKALKLYFDSGRAGVNLFIRYKLAGTPVHQLRHSIRRI